MFTLAQYVFGIGKSEENGQQHPLNDPSVGASPPHSPLASGENDVNNSHCVQTNIEDDWILVEVGDENSNIKSRVKPKTRGSKQHSKSNNNKKIQGSSTKAKSKSKSNQEKWVVDPPECFKPVDTKKKCSLKPSEESSPTVVDDSKENLLIEFPSTTVFESLFVKRSDTESQTESQVNPASAVEEIPSTDAVSVDLVLVSSSNSSSPSPVSPAGLASSKKARRKNSPKSRKALETVSHSAAVNAAISQNQAIVAVVASGENKKRKRSITRKHHDRQNRVSVQRNGPIIRGKKMFAQINGAYQCNRAHC